MIDGPPPVRLSASDVVNPVGFKCGLVNGKLVCGKKQGGGRKQDEDDDNDDKPHKSKDKIIPKACGKKVNCEGGFVKLAEPNKYGACCEAREGLPPPANTSSQSNTGSDGAKTTPQVPTSSAASSLKRKD